MKKQMTIDTSKLGGLILDFLFEEDFEVEGFEIHDAVNWMGKTEAERARGETTYDPGPVTDAICGLVASGYVRVHHAKGLGAMYSLTDHALHTLERFELNETLVEPWV
jgi:hypothetical protein